MCAYVKQPALETAAAAAVSHKSVLLCWSAGKAHAAAVGPPPPVVTVHTAHFHSAVTLLALCLPAPVSLLCMLPVLQLASRLEVLNRLRQEKAELAALKQDPLGTVVDTKSESLARLQAMRQQQQPKAVAAGGSSSQQQQQLEEADADAGGGGPSSSGRAAAADGSNGTAVAAAAAGGGEEDAAAASDGEEGAGGDPYAGMNPRQRKLYGLKQKMQQARKANENAIIAERKRMRVRGARVEGVTEGAGCDSCACSLVATPAVIQA